MARSDVHVIQSDSTRADWRWLDCTCGESFCGPAERAAGEFDDHILDAIRVNTAADKAV